ncbi:E3 ubiquitin-protein ligase CIP8-like [Panicum virgatum]|uniref:E3 ubiquitin-protein ligase CIP8-like n=1 Tax=Panicum virgatum TaxID=38727 RepID=UPI0019D5A7DE|nr:E3 ubiquitin-protein ligase CIP8-like [Panicum virgatum]
MAAAAPSIASPFIALGVIACIGALGAVICASKDSAAAAAVGRPQQGGGGGQQQRGPGPDPWGDGDVELCAICKARLAEAGWGGRRRLRPCGHVYHADCIGLWLQRRWTCPVCRADVLLSPTEIMDAMV